MNTKITTIIFDCFGVICDPPISGWHKENRLKHGLIDSNLQNFLKDFDLGNKSEDDVLEYFLKYKGVNSTKEELRKDIDSYLKLDTKLASIITKLKDNGFKTVLLSNANSAFFERKAYQIYPEFKDLFDKIIISSEIKMVKPNPDIYLYTLKEIGAKPEECLFVDDSKTNVDASVKLGIKGFVYTEITSFRKHLEELGINLL